LENTVAFAPEDITQKDAEVVLPMIKGRLVEIIERLLPISASKMADALGDPEHPLTREAESLSRVAKALGIGYRIVPNHTKTQFVYHLEGWDRGNAD
jgi:hypothetical protein